MSFSGVLLAVAVVGGVGLFIGLFLGIAAIKFKVEVDEKEEAVLAALPGNNCGGCGFPGCSGLAAAIAKGEAPVNACPVGGEPVGKVIAGIMCVEAEESVRMTAFVQCQGDCDKVTFDYDYSGIEDCRMLSSCLTGVRKAVTMGALDMEAVCRPAPLMPFSWKTVWQWWIRKNAKPAESVWKSVPRS